MNNRIPQGLSHPMYLLSSLQAKSGSSRLCTRSVHSLHKTGSPKRWNITKGGTVTPVLEVHKWLSSSNSWVMADCGKTSFQIFCLVNSFSTTTLKHIHPHNKHQPPFMSVFDLTSCGQARENSDMAWQSHCAWPTGECTCCASPWLNPQHVLCVTESLLSPLPPLRQVLCKVCRSAYHTQPSHTLMPDSKGIFGAFP